MNTELAKFLSGLPVGHKLSQVLIKADKLGSVAINQHDRSYTAFIKICIHAREKIWAIDKIHMNDSQLVKLADNMDDFIKECVTTTAPIGDTLNHVINSACIDLGPIKPSTIDLSPYVSTNPVNTEGISIDTIVKFYNDIKKEFKSRGDFNISIPKLVDVLFKLGVVCTNDED